MAWCKLPSAGFWYIGHVKSCIILDANSFSLAVTCGVPLLLSLQPSALPSGYKALDKEAITSSPSSGASSLWSTTVHQENVKKPRGRPATARFDTLVREMSDLLCLDVRCRWAKRHLFNFDVSCSCLGSASGLTSLKSFAPSSLPSPTLGLWNYSSAWMP